MKNTFLILAILQALPLIAAGADAPIGDPGNQKGTVRRVEDMRNLLSNLYSDTSKLFTEENDAITPLWPAKEEAEALAEKATAAVADGAAPTLAAQVQVEAQNFSKKWEAIHDEKKQLAPQFEQRYQKLTDANKFAEINSELLSISQQLEKDRASASGCLQDAKNVRGEPFQSKATVLIGECTRECDKYERASPIYKASFESFRQFQRDAASNGENPRISKYHSQAQSLVVNTERQYKVKMAFGGKEVQSSFVASAGSFVANLNPAVKKTYEDFSQAMKTLALKLKTDAQEPLGASAGGASEAIRGIQEIHGRITQGAGSCANGTAAN